MLEYQTIMIIKQHYHVGETLQRSIVESGGHTLRRIVCYVTPEGELTKTLPVDGPIWQERQNDGEYHNIGLELSRKNERRFIDALIAANGLDKR